MDAKKMIVRIAQRMDEKNLTNAFEGNVSVMEGGLLYITPSGQNKGCIDESMIAVMDENGNQVDGCFPPSSEYKMHRDVYKMRNDIGGALYTPMHLSLRRLPCAENPFAFRSMPSLLGIISVRRFCRMADRARRRCMRERRKFWHRAGTSFCWQIMGL